MGDLGKLIVAKDFKNLPKVQQIAQSGHTTWDPLVYYASVPWNKSISLSLNFAKYPLATITFSPTNSSGIWTHKPAIESWFVNLHLRIV